MLYFIISFLIFTVVAATRIPVTLQQQRAPEAIFLLAGQSNMAGRGGVYNHTVTHELTWDGVVPRECTPTLSILRLDANLSWVEAREPLHADIDFHKTNGVGPGLPFAHAIIMNESEGDRKVIGLVPCAIGGTAITEWEQGSVLYNQLLERAKASVVSGGTIKALLWFQGESDTLNPQDSDLYGARLNNFFTNIRSDLNIPLLPIIQVGIASGMGPYMEGVRRGQFGTDVPNVITVDAKGLALEYDELHLTTHSQLILGTRLAHAYRSYLSGPALPPAPAPAPQSTNAAPTFSTSSHSNFLISIFTIFTFLFWL